MVLPVVPKRIFIPVGQDATGVMVKEVFPALMTNASEGCVGEPGLPIANKYGSEMVSRPFRAEIEMLAGWDWLTGVHSVAAKTGLATNSAIRASDCRIKLSMAKVGGG